MQSYILNKYSRGYDSRWNKKNQNRYRNRDESTLLTINRRLLDSCTDGKLNEATDLIKEGASVNHKNEHGYSPLLKAAANGHVDICQLLIKNGANVNAIYNDNIGPTALMKAATNGHVHVCRLLIQASDRQVNYRDSIGSTPLMKAATNGHVHVCRLLIDKGADIHAKTKNGWTALHRAALCDNEAIVYLLIEKGANTQIKRGDGKTALDIAKSNNKIMNTAILEAASRGKELPSINNKATSAGAYSAASNRLGTVKTSINTLTYAYDTVKKSVHSTTLTDTCDTAPNVLNQHDVTINIGRKFNNAIRYTTVFVGSGHSIKTQMKISQLQKEECRMFRKSYTDSELQMIVRVSVDGHVHYIDEDVFDKVTLQSIINRCQFDTSKIPIEIMIKEWNNASSDISVAYPSAPHAIPTQSAAPSLTNPLPSAPLLGSDIVVEAEIVNPNAQE